jgi:DNA polymerase (family 10)
MDKTRVAAILNEIGTLLELQGENPFRANAYHNAARAIEQLEGSLEELVAQKRLGEIKGIGESMQEKITALVTTGRLPFYEELRARFPPGLLDLLRIPGLGPKKAKVLFEQLAIDSLEKLRQACQSGKVAELKGFGLKTQQKILEGLEFLDRTGKRYLLSEAQEIAERVLRQLRDLPGVLRGEICGSVRRRKETIGDLDILLSAENPEPVMEAFVRLPEVAQVAARGPTKSSVVLENGISCDLRVVSDTQFPFALHYFTGSKEHNIAMRARAQSYGLKLNEYELAGPRRSIPCKEESDIFAALDMDYIPPELRENTGEIEAAASHCLPQLLEAKDLRGTFHVHTDWSDGAASLEEMALAAKKLGLKYLGIADHSQSLTVANGLSPLRVKQQLAEIDALNRRLTGIRLLKGTECDILPDGSLDYDDALLSRFDYVIASVHSHFNQSPEEMTQRLIRALSHPKVLMLGHPTGRLLLRREGYKADLDQVLKAAAEHDKMIEINANPYRLDLDWIHCKHAKALGVKLVINPDAHAPAELRFLQYGVDVARRGWLSRSDVFNTLPLSQVLRRLHRPAQR